ncbi:hypothetical protein ACFL3N_02445 [Candidatus Omnitrophota bacterium]
MTKKNQDLQKNLAQVWETTQKQLNTMVKEATVLARKSEAYIRDISGRGKIEAEILIFRARREKLYYELGKAVAGSSGKNREKKIEEIKGQVSELSKSIKHNEKLLK